MRTIRELLTATRAMIARTAESNRNALGGGVTPGLYSPAESVDRAMDLLSASANRTVAGEGAKASTYGGVQSWPYFVQEREREALAAANKEYRDAYAAARAMDDRQANELADAVAKLSGWRMSAAWLNANAHDVDGIVALYAKRIKMRRKWFPYSDQWPKHSNMYRWVVDTETPNQYGIRMGFKGCKHNVIATEQALCYRKALRWFLRADGITDVNLHTVECLLNERAAASGNTAYIEAARVHGYWKGRNAQDAKQDRDMIDPETALASLKVTHSLERLQSDSRIRSAITAIHSFK